MNKHTPGPWKLDVSDNPIYWIAIDTGRYSMEIERKYLADARLIAAAPETATERDQLKEVNSILLEALIAVTSPEYYNAVLNTIIYHEWDDPPIVVKIDEQVRVAIANAKGE